MFALLIGLFLHLNLSYFKKKMKSVNPFQSEGCIHLISRNEFAHSLINCFPNTRLTLGEK